MNLKTNVQTEEKIEDIEKRISDFENDPEKDNKIKDFIKVIKRRINYI